MPRFGALFVGCYGASASTLLASLSANLTQQESFKLGSYWCTATGDYHPGVGAMAIGGWDYAAASLAEALARNGLVKSNEIVPIREPHLFPAIVGPGDYAARREGIAPTHGSLREAIDAAKKDIIAFRTQQKCTRVMVCNTSSPILCTDTSRKLWSAATAYSVGSVECGADWVEFTPSDTITAELLALSNSTGSRLAGRDGSTGQTILKAALAEFLVRRGLRIDHWYSTNLIGNHDGLVLSDEDYCRTKLEDKRKALDDVLDDPGAHIVEIQYVPPAGDDKEAWDCVHFTGWSNARMSLRVNWLGKDSFLAAPLLLDILSGLMLADDVGRGPGLIPELGIFFKHPLGLQRCTHSDLVALLEQYIGQQRR